MRHVISKQRELQPGATALDAFEDLLSRFDKRAVGGAKRWFGDLAGLRGYWFDKRMQTLSLEMLSVADNLVVERATPTDLLYGQRAFPAHLPDTNEEWRALFDSLSSGIEGIRQACLKAWAQCEAYDVQESASERRLDVAFVAGEYFLLHEDLAPTQSQVRDWLQSEVWPAHPRRAVVLVSREMLQPVWLINPLL